MVFQFNRFNYLNDRAIRIINLPAVNKRDFYEIHSREKLIKFEKRKILLKRGEKLLPNGFGEKSYLIEN